MFPFLLRSGKSKRAVKGTTDHSQCVESLDGCSFYYIENVGTLQSVFFKLISDCLGSQAKPVERHEVLGSSPLPNADKPTWILNILLNLAK